MFAPQVNVANRNTLNADSRRSLPTNRVTDIAALSAPAMLQRSVGNQAVLRQISQTNPTSQTGAGGVQSGGKTDCAGSWNTDPVSLSERAAKQYLQDNFHMTRHSDTMVCSPTECRLHYKNGSSPFDVIVYLDEISVNHVAVYCPSIGGRPGPYCDYSYECDAAGELHFKSPWCL